MEQEREQAERRDRCIQRSIKAGIKSGLIALAFSSISVYLANTYSIAFRTSLGVSGKTALVTTPMMFMFFLRSELEMGACKSEQIDALALNFEWKK